jgi:hypothetical protein
VKRSQAESLVRFLNNRETMLMSCDLYGDYCHEYTDEEFIRLLMEWDDTSSQEDNSRSQCNLSALTLSSGDTKALHSN